jgi:predicted nuclease of restriction endonuclease-like (RecB) superfamily
MIESTPPNAFQPPDLPEDTYHTILADIVGLLEAARHSAARAVNTVMTVTYWEIGRRFVQWEQGGQERAAYGEQLILRLAADLTARFGRGFRRSNLYQMRAFYLAYADIVQTPSGQSTLTPQDAVAQLHTNALELHRSPFPLPWSHYVRLLAIDNPEARRFYEEEALRGGWSVRQLRRQIASQFYERTLLSRNKAAMLTRGRRPRPEDRVTPEEQIKDPFVLEFLDLQDEYSESDLEEALIRQLERFLLELGGDFAFIGRQRRLRVGHAWYRVDLVFFHRRLRCLILIDLKLDAFSPADVGQMNLYVNYARAHWTYPDENPPVGLILCAAKDEAVARYALEGLHSDVLAAEYRLALPDETSLRTELERTRRLLEERAREPGDASTP